MAETVRIAVGLDTARYGHCAHFLSEDLQPAAKRLAFQESREGYDQFEAVLRRLARRHGESVHFEIRIDAAGQYAANLEAFLHQLDFAKTISVGRPKANKDYKNVHFPKRKSDDVDSHACARFAMVERPGPSPRTPTSFVQLRDLASALISARKSTTRHVNRLHNHLARVFPELALEAAGIDADWVLTLLDKYPTPQRIAAARAASLTSIPHVDDARAARLQQAAAQSVGALNGPVAEKMIRKLVADVRHSQQAEREFMSLLQQAFDGLPEGGHRQLITIAGIGKRTAAALVAKAVSIDRFPTPDALVNYFGAFPEEDTSGVDKWGNPVPKGTMRMSIKGNDLVRGLLWMAAQSAAKSNPAVRALYRRQVAAGKKPAVALGHCMRKLLHLVYAVWKTNRPFDPDHYPWDPDDGPQPDAPPADNSQAAQHARGNDSAAHKSAAGRKGQSPVGKAVTAATIQMATRIVPPAQAVAKPPTANQPPVDFAHIRSQLRMTDVLEKLGLLARMKGPGPQRRGPCPIHEPDKPSGRSFSVNLDKHVFRCLNPSCAAQGNLLHLWAAVHRLPLFDAAHHLANAFNLETQPTKPRSTSKMETTQ